MLGARAWEHPAPPTERSTIPASHEAIGREIQWTGDGRVPVWEHFVLQAGYAMTGRRRYPAGPGREQIACTGMPEAPGTPAA